MPIQNKLNAHKISIITFNISFKNSNKKRQKSGFQRHYFRHKGTFFQGILSLRETVSLEHSTRIQTRKHTHTQTLQTFIITLKILLIERNLAIYYILQEGITEKHVSVSIRQASFYKNFINVKQKLFKKTFQFNMLSFAIFDT